MRNEHSDDGDAPLSSYAAGVDVELVGSDKSWRYWIVLWFTVAFCLAEIVVAILTHSLALLSEAFHNIGDVFTLLIALHVDRNKQRAATAEYSYGLKRIEVVGALLNGCSLLSLSFFVVLQAIPRFFEPVDVQSGVLFLSTAGVGLLVNVLGVCCFAGHGHSHGLSSAPGGGCSHGHSHGGAAPALASKSTSHDEHGHGHSHGDGGACHGNHHAHADDEVEVPSPPRSRPQSRALLPSSESPLIRMRPSPAERVAVSSSTASGLAATHGTPLLHSETHACTGHHNHDHAHDEHAHHDHDAHAHHDHDSHAHHDHDEHEHHAHDAHDEHESDDLNMRAAFLHFLADSLSSICVLGVGLCLYFFHDTAWAQYVDPASSLVIVCITVYLTYPLVKQCVAIVMQSTPENVDHVMLARELRSSSARVAHVHALHTWSQNGGVHIGTAHVVVAAEDDADAQAAAQWLPALMSRLRSVFHKHNVHDTSIQTELVVRGAANKLASGCVEVCAPDCHATATTR